MIMTMRKSSAVSPYTDEEKEREIHVYCLWKIGEKVIFQRSLSSLARKQ